MKRIISLVVAVCTFFCMAGLLGQTSGAADISDYIKGVYTDDQLGKSIMYRLFVPDDYDENKEYPLVIFLHGRGDLDLNNEAQLRGAYSAANRLIEDDYLEKYPCIILAPQCYDYQMWFLAKDILMSLITSITETYSIDTDRLYLTGLSLGGYGTWEMLEAYPGVFAAAAPLCGGHVTENYKSLTITPTWVFHGAKDSTVPVENSRELIDLIVKAGGKNIKYTELPRGKHDIWNTVYRLDELYEWMFAQRLGQEPVWGSIFDVFTDVTMDRWYYDAVRFVYYKNIFKGVSEDKFAPDLKMTRAMFVTVLHRMEGEPNSNSSSTNFADVPNGTWYSDAVKWASEKGIVYGKSKTEFAPDEFISREQLVTMMYRYANYCLLDTSGWADESKFSDFSSVSDYAKPAVLWAVRERLIEGKEEKIMAPKDSATRSECATIIKRFIEHKDNYSH